MIKIFPFLFTFIFCFSSFAQTSAVFAKNGKKATVLMLATTQNIDAVMFNESLHFEAEDINGKWTKKFEFADGFGQRNLSVVCVFSKLVSTTGSCTVVFYASENILINNTTKSISGVFDGQDALSLSSYFNPADAQGEIFRSSDNHFIISTQMAPNGSISTLHFLYQP